MNKDRVDQQVNPNSSAQMSGFSDEERRKFNELIKTNPSAHCLGLYLFRIFGSEIPIESVRSCLNILNPKA